MATDQKSITIAAAGHPLAAGLTGVVNVTRFPLPFSWGKPAPSAVTVATLMGGADRAALFAYEKGAMLLGLRSPARRVGFFVGSLGPGGFAAPGERLLAAAFHWAATPRALLVVGGLPLSPGDGATADRLEALGFHVVAVLDREVNVLEEKRATDVIVVSGSASVESPIGQLRRSTLPLVVGNSGLYERLGMVAPGLPSSGQVDGVTGLTVVAPSHPVGAGISGAVSVTASPQSFGWGTPTRWGKVIATVNDKAAVFVFERRTVRFDDRSDGGAEQGPPVSDGGGGGVPDERLLGRRVGWFGGPAAMAGLTRGGWALFDAAVLWAAGHPVTPYLACLSSSGAVVTADSPAGSTDLFSAILPGTSLTVGIPGADVQQFDAPRVLEIPFSLPVPTTLGVASVELIFQQARCSRPAASDADAWTPLPGGDITCSYSAQSAQASEVVLRACSGGLSAHDAIITSGVRVGASPAPAPGSMLKVSVPGLGGGVLEEPIPPAEGARLRDTFDWATTQPLPEVDAQGRPTVWYVAIHVGSRAERERLDLLPRGSSRMPLFRSEFERWHGLRGFLLHRGDGRGYFVFSLVTGRLYNAMRDQALQADPVFRVVALRDVPPEARAADGSVSYEAAPLLPAARADAATDAFTRMGRDEDPIDRLARTEAARLPRPRLRITSSTDTTPFTVITDLRTTDPLFGGPVPPTPLVPDLSQPMFRTWGSARGRQVELEGLPVTALFGGGQISGPYDMEPTDTNGAVTLHLPRGASVWAIEATLQGPGATLVAEDLNLWGIVTPSDTLERDFQYWDFPIGQITPPDTGVTFHVQIQHGYFNLLAQANEAHAFAAESLGLDVPPANISVGWLASQMGSQQSSGKAMFTPCFGMFGSKMVAWLRNRLPTDNAFQGFLLMLLHVFGAGSAAAGDIYVPVDPDDGQALSRGVLSHEYGHYLVCAMVGQSGIQDEWIAYGIMAEQRLTTNTGPGLEAAWMNEGLADFFAAQLAGGANYFSLGPVYGVGPVYYCLSTGSGLCLERNNTPPDPSDDSPAAFDAEIARFTTLLDDVVDLQPTSTLTSGRVWKWWEQQDVWRLQYDPTSNGLRDSEDEAISLAPTQLPMLIAQAVRPEILYVNGEPVSATGVDEATFMTRMDQMLAGSYSWCDRCRLSAIHEDPALAVASVGTNKPSMTASNEVCTSSARIMSWMPPPPNADLPESCNYGQCTQDRVCYSPCLVIHPCVNGFAEPCIPGEAPAGTACRDADGDGYYGSGSCISYCGSPPPGYFDQAGHLPEGDACDADSARHPGAAPVCNQDMDCDTHSDCSSAWACCPGTSYSNVDLGAFSAVDCGQGPLPAVSSCSAGSNCAEVTSLPTVHHWSGAGISDSERFAANMSHSCGYAEGDRWIVPYDQDDDCWAQWGPYVDAIEPGSYTIGVLLNSLESTEVGVDVAERGGTQILAEYGGWIDASDTGTCIAFSGVWLEPCQQIEARVRFIRHWYDPHTLVIMSTSIKPDGAPGPACW